MNPPILDKNGVQAAARYGSAIIADASKSLPTKIEVLRAGTWPETSNKGSLWITPDDLQSFVDNFKAGVGVPGGKDFGQLPIDFSHNDWEEAAGWIVDLTIEGIVLFATVEWTDAGAAALKGGMYKCFSPSFWPACLGEWYDPEDYSVTAKNVLVGGGLTNIPFFKDLTAIMASNAGNSKDRKKNVKAQKENHVPTLDEVRIKEVASLQADDKVVLVQAAKDGKLSDLEKTKFAEVITASAGNTATVNASATNGVSAEDQAILASIKDGKMKVVEASKYDALESTVGKLQASVQQRDEAEAKAFVKAHVDRGAIKPDQAEKWEKRIVADAGFKDDLIAMKGEPLLASEKGGEGEETLDESVIDSKVRTKLEAARSKGESPSYREVRASVINEMKGEAKK